MAKTSCGCETRSKDATGLWAGVMYGLLPHSVCIAFIVLSVIGATVAVGMVRQLLLIPYLFHVLIGLSILFATLSAAFYLRRNSLLSWGGVQKKWRYLSVLYGTTLAVNLLLFWVLLPAAANVSASDAPAAVEGKMGQGAAVAVAEDSTVTLTVDIPCPGHAPLIVGELKTLAGIKNVAYRVPNVFTVTYDTSQTSLGRIVSLEVFETYRAVVGP